MTKLTKEKKDIEWYKRKLLPLRIISNIDIVRCLKFSQIKLFYKNLFLSVQHE